MTSGKTTRLLMTLLGLAWLVVPAAAHGDSVYTYAGNAYNLCSGTYEVSGACVSAALSVSFGVANPLADGLDLKDITKKLTSLTITDGTGLDITLTNASISDFEISTDPTSGAITEWVLDLGGSVTDSITGDVTSYFVLSEDEGPGFNRDHSETSIAAPNKKGKLVEFSDGVGENDGSGLISEAPPTAAGTWTNPNTAAVPEPSTLLMLGIGFFAVALSLRFFRLSGATHTIVS